MADKPTMLPTSTSPSQPPTGTASASTITRTSMPPPPPSLHSRSSFSFPSAFARLTNTSTTMAQTATPSPPSSSHQSTPAPAPAPAPTPVHSANSSSSSKGTENREFAKMDITSLMSPPDQVLDSFNTEGYKKASMASNPSHPSYDYQSLSGQKQPLPMSPPVSPYSKAISHHDAPSTPPAQPVSDPVLYPADESATPSPPHAPLFAPSEEVQKNQRIIDSHRARSITQSLTHPPSDSEYHLILSFRSQVMTHFKANPRGWLRKERALLEADRRATAHRYHAIMPAKPKSAIAAKPPRVARADRVTKPATVSNSNAAPRTIRTGAGPIPGHSPGKRSTSRASSTPEPSRRAVAPNREDKDFNSIPDYCPPSTSLPSRSNSLKIEWKGQPIDLSNDPHAHLLHPDEVSLAGNLRLDCATYLTSKRRIFERRLQCLRSGKEFRKTDAQQACKIDVNKASKLWTAFEKVGWLDAKWVRSFA